MCGENDLFEIFKSADFDGGDFLSPIYLSNINTWQAKGFEKIDFLKVTGDLYD